MRHDTTILRQRLSGDGGGDLGASLVEYAMLVSLVVLVCVFAIEALGDRTEERFDDRWGCNGGVDQFDDYGTPPSVSCP